MKRFIFILLVVFAPYICAQGNEPFIEGDTLEFQLNDLHRNSISSGDTLFNGKVIYMTLWGTWCPPCISEIPSLIELQKEYGNSGLIIAAVAFEREKENKTRRERLFKFKEEHNINYIVLDGGTPKNFENVFPAIQNVEGLPIEILINRKGKVEVIRNSYGYSDVWIGRLKKEIKTLLSQQ